jgi:hypothetical protein
MSHAAAQPTHAETTGDRIGQKYAIPIVVARSWRPVLEAIPKRPDARLVGMGGVSEFRNPARLRDYQERGSAMTDQWRCLHELLLAYLRAADAPRWPGADSLTLEDALRSYSQAAADGLVPDLPALLASHPELTDILNDFFARSGSLPRSP